MFPLLPVTFTLGSGLTFEHSLPCRWKEVPLALTGVMRICLNTIFVNCDPAPSRGAAEWRKEEESRRQFWVPVPLPPELFALPGQAV